MIKNNQNDCDTKAYIIRYCGPEFNSRQVHHRQSGQTFDTKDSNLADKNEKREIHAFEFKHGVLINGILAF